MRISHASSVSLLALCLAVTACHDASAPPATSATASTSATATGGPIDARRKELRTLIDEQWEYTMKTSPEFATIIGDYRYNDRWGDVSDKAVQDDLAATKRFLDRLKPIDTTGFPEQERLDKELLSRKLELELEGARFEGWLMPVNQFQSPHLFLAEFPSLLPFASVKHYDDYIKRLQTLPAVLDGMVGFLKEGLAKGLIPPKILLGKVSQQADAIATDKLEESAFAAPLKTFPASVPPAEQARIKKAVLAAIQDNVNPAYKRFAAYVRAEYEPHGRTEPGEWSLPLGQERYAYDIKTSTTTAMSADEIHALGLREVTRIEAEMKATAKKLGFNDLPSLAASMARNPALHFTSRQAVVDLYQKYTDQMYPKLPTLFGRLPQAKLTILPDEEFREKGASAAEYIPGTTDGVRPGHVMVNTGDFAARSTISVETTAYHEGVPGHHLQLTIAQEITGLPPFRQHYDVTSFAEGWALYAERLGEEVGFYQDPYSYYGHLQDEMLRAIRLVVDTGFHAKKWTRQQVVDFFHAHSTSDEVEVQSETDRYIAIPGQALAYKIGQLKILELREKAKRELGDKFDIRGFHDTVLGAGSLPLDVLEEQVNLWIASRKNS